MNISRYKRRFQEDVIVYIEEYNKYEGTVLFDFLDSNEFSIFNSIFTTGSALGDPSMILLFNYYGRRIQENTFYVIKHNVLELLSQQTQGAAEISDSYLIGFRLDASKSEEQIFHKSISPDFEDIWFLNMPFGSSYDNEIPLPIGSKYSVTIRNVGQGNWNEININNEVKIVFDAGAPTYASKDDVRKIIGNRNTVYPLLKPIIILSHWDKDHYHSLCGMTDIELRDNFSAFVCRDFRPNLTSRILFGRISKSLGNSNTFAIPPVEPSKNVKLTAFVKLYTKNQQLNLYNSEQHKNRNISGLAMAIKTQHNSCVLPGDAHYEQISRDVIPHLNYRHEHYLVVPHHGGKAGKLIYKLPMQVRPKLAIISVGKNHFNHPDEKNIVELKKLGFKIASTKIVNKDITVSL